MNKKQLNKKCTKCGKMKLLDAFCRDKKKKDGLNIWCKECYKNYRKIHKKEIEEKDRKRGKVYREKHKKEIANRIKMWQQRNKERLSLVAKEKYNKNIKKILKRTKKYRETHKEQIKEYLKLNKDKVAKWKKEYYEKNKTKFLELKRKKFKKRLKNDINFKLGRYLRSRMWEALKGNPKISTTIKLVGCSIENLKKHLESKFKPNMSWNNYGYYGWHIDHIKPCAKFDLTKPIEQRKCFHYTNLQPLWWKENLRKGNSYEK